MRQDPGLQIELPRHPQCHLDNKRHGQNSGVLGAEDPSQPGRRHSAAMPRDCLPLLHHVHQALLGARSICRRVGTLDKDILYTKVLIRSQDMIAAHGRFLPSLFDTYSLHRPFWCGLGWDLFAVEHMDS